MKKYEKYISEIPKRKYKSPEIHKRAMTPKQLKCQSMAKLARKTRKVGLKGAPTNTNTSDFVVW